MKKDLLLELLSLFERKDFLYLYELAESSFWKLKEIDQQFLKKLADNPHRYQQLYNAEKTVNSSNFNYRKKAIIQLIEDYILLLENREAKHETNRNLQLVNFYNEKRLVNNYKKMLAKTEKNIENRPLNKDTALLKFRYYEVQATNSRINRKKMPELEKMNKALWAFFVENNLRIVCEAQTQKEIINLNYNILNIDPSLVPQIDFSEKKEIFVKEIYENIQQLSIVSKSEKNYNFLKDVVKNNASNISLELLKTIYIHLMNYAIKQINLGEAAYASEYLFYVDSLIKQNLFLERNRLDYGRYRNTIIAYLIQSPIDFTRVHKFIDEYKESLDFPYAMDIVKINSIYVSLFEKKYREAHEELHQLTDRNLDLHHKIMFKKLDLRLMLMLGNNGEVFEKKVYNFKRFLQAQSQLKGGKKLEVSIGFIKCLNKMATKDLTLEELKNTNLTLTDKIWFLAKILEKSQALP